MVIVALVPNIITMNSLMTKVENFNEGKEVLKSIEQYKLVPNIITINSLMSKVQNFKEGKQNIGIIDQIVDNDKPQFIHRTFAEYLIAIYFIKCLQNKQSIEKFKKIFLLLL